MKPPVLRAVFDEAGTQNEPGTSESSFEFCWSGILFSDMEENLILKWDDSIKKATKSRDYKHHHVAKSSKARAAFLSSEYIGRIGVFVNYCSGESFSARRTRHAQANGLDDKAYANLDTRHDNSIAAIQTAGLAIAAELCRNQLDCDVHFDTRSDGSRLFPAFTDAARAMINDEYRRGKIKRVPRLAADTASGAPAKAATRIAGVFAMDVVRYFRIHGCRVWSQMSHEVHSALASAQNLREVSRVRSRLACAQPRVGSRESCLLQGYTKSLLNRELSFTSPDGLRGRIRVKHGNDWSILQASDNPARPN